MTQTTLLASATAAVGLLLSSATLAADGPVSDEYIAKQRAVLAEVTNDAGFGPQSPRDLTSAEGANARFSGTAPSHTMMNLCNIHFHENAEHRGGDFTVYAGNGDGKGTGTGFKFDGALSEAELAPIAAPIGAGKYGDLAPGDTIEIHFVHSSAQVTPGPTLGACVSEAIGNPHLRVETVVAVLVNDADAADFGEMAELAVVDGYSQAPNLPTDLGTPVMYAGSTTGPSYNEAASPFHVTWSVRPKTVKLDISSVGAWLGNNPFDETAAHGVRNLVVNPMLLSPIEG